MTRYVIDTNVPVVANGNDLSVKLSCRIAAIELLRKAVRDGKIFLDTEGQIQNEYRTHLNPRGQPGTGDYFYREIINSHPDRVTRVEVSRRADGEYEDVPQEIIDAGFDPSDRKFVAVALKSDACVHNAVDTDWVECRTVLEQNGVDIKFLCGCDPNQWRGAE
jgi:predicted nucleic acid-binding protein